MLFLAALPALHRRAGAALCLVAAVLAGHPQSLQANAYAPTSQGASTAAPADALHARPTRYGPFVILDAARAALIADTDARSPADFARLLADHPAIAVLELVDAPGTRDDRANFAVARMIRRHGIDTVVPAGGSARSGAVELFLAGSHRFVHESAEFAVHSWRDVHGMQPRDYPPDDPSNRAYLDYYVEMGLTPDQSRRFYAMTNSVGFDQARWLSAQEMRAYVDFVFVS